MIRRLAVLVCLAGVCCLAVEDGEREETRWWRGNTHTHTLWSDGDGAPELVSKWYRDNGYDFLVLSDHNILSEGEKWFPVTEDGRLTKARVNQLDETFGEEWATYRIAGEAWDMRLKTLDELREHFEVPGEFLFIQGEEITDSYEGAPVHVNGLNLQELIDPQGGTSVRDTAQRNIDAVIEQSRRIGRPMLAHLNHPNFGWAFTPDDVARLRGESFFEVYNGHSSVRNYGDADHPGLEELWDRALTQRLTELDLGLLYGLATDDAHHYFEFGLGKANTGRGWVMVRAATLGRDAIVEAMLAGDFYSSSGVTLSDFQADDSRFVVHIAAEEGVDYTTRFLGTRVTPDGHGDVGEVLFETTKNPAVYAFEGDELYVRATVVSSKPHPNPYAAGDLETAWVQPVQRGKNQTFR